MKIPYTSALYGLLRKSERYTKTDMVYLAKGGSWLGIGQVLSSISGLILALALGNFLTPETYGTYRYILSLTVLAMASMAGLDTACVQAVARGFEKTYLSVNTAKLKWSLLGTLIGCICAGYYLFQGQALLAGGIALMSLSLPLTEGLTAFQAYLSGKKLFGPLTSFATLVRLGQVGSIIGFTVLSPDLITVVIATFGSLAVLRIIATVRVLRAYPPKGEVDPGAFRYGAQITASGIIAGVADQLDKMLIFTLLGPAQLAIYSIAIAPPDQLKTIVKQLQQLALPRFSENDLASIKKTLFRKIVLLSGIFVIIAAIYILCAPAFFQLLLPQYITSIPYSQVFALSLVTLPLLVIVSAFQAQKMTTAIYQHQTLTSIAQIIATVLCIHFFGLWGAILARIIYRVFAYILAVALLKNAKT